MGKGLLLIFAASLFLLMPYQPPEAQENAETIDNVMTWWEHYGKYWTTID